MTAEEAAGEPIRQKKMRAKFAQVDDAIVERLKQGYRINATGRKLLYLTGRPVRTYTVAIGSFRVECVPILGKLVNVYDCCNYLRWPDDDGDYVYRRPAPLQSRVAQPEPAPSQPRRGVVESISWMLARYR